VKLNTRDEKAHYNLALLFARLKNRERAQEEMQIVEKLKSSRQAKEGAAGTAPEPKPPE
jgi:hypothetical protein